MVPFKFDERRWHGCKYVLVEPDTAGINAQAVWDDMTAWCITHFGDEGDAWSDQAERWYRNAGNFWFRNEEDLAWFVINW